MAQTGHESFDSTLQKTHIWLNELKEQMSFQDDRQAYFLLRTALHCLRDRLPAEEAVHLGAQLPMLIRGMYYDGFALRTKGDQPRTKEEFLSEARQRFNQDPQMDVEKGIRAVFELLNRHITGGEMEHVRRILPEPLRELIPAA